MSFKKEMTAWRNNPFTFKASEAVVAHLRKKIKRNPNQALMCRYCGCVFIVGSDAARSRSKTAHNYCSNECKYHDRKRLYSNNPLMHEEICRKRGAVKRYPHSKVHVYECKQCGKPEVIRRKSSRVVCGECCASNAKEKQSHEMKLKYFQQRIDAASLAAETKECKECGSAYTPIRKAARQCCSRECLKKHQRRERKHKRRELQRLPDGIQRGRTGLSFLMKKFKGICVQCGCKVVRSNEYLPNQATADHIIPLSKGGLHIESNLQLMCQACNGRKSNLIEKQQQLWLL